MFCAEKLPYHIIRSEEKLSVPNPVTPISPSSLSLSAYALPRKTEDNTIASPKIIELIYGFMNL